MFPVFDIPPDAAELPEQMGTKFKFWYEDRLLGRTLFKEGRPNTGENWAEKLAGEFALMLGVPHAVYELAQWRDKIGVLSPSFVPESSRLIHGNELLGGKVTDAEDDNQLKYYAQRNHTAFAVLGLLKQSTAVQPPLAYMQIGNLTSAVDIFVGYLLLDAWIANQDRHSENWGLVRIRDVFHLAPSYDHGSSLARNETDQRRKQILTTRDKGASIEAYVQKAKSALFPLSAPGSKVRSLFTVEAFEFAWRARPDAGNVWRERLASIPLENIKDTIGQVPDKYMTPVAKEFTERLLKTNRDRLLALKIEK
jgi:hypothetical protein